MFTVPNVRIEMLKKFLLYSFPYKWNQAGDISFQTNKITFQIALKNLLITDCYDNQRDLLPPPPPQPFVIPE